MDDEKQVRPRKANGMISMFAAFEPIVNDKAERIVPDLLR